jgi:lactate 2-monooxygenase
MSAHDQQASKPKAYAAYQRELYGRMRPPPFTTNSTAWEGLAKRLVPHGNFFYVAGSAGQSRTCTANTDAFDRYRWRPRMLVDATVRDCSVTLFGKKYPNPLLVAPIGVQEIMHKDAEEATARACKDVGIPMVLSTAATRTIEQVAAANGDGTRWFQVSHPVHRAFCQAHACPQLYWPKPGDDDITASMLKRAWENGYEALVVTADTFTLGWRPADLDTAYLPFMWGQGCAIGFSDPVFRRKYAAARVQKDAEERKRPLWTRIKEALAMMLRPRSLLGALRVFWNANTLRMAQAWVDVVFSGSFRSWDALPLLREHWPGPILVKGIQTVGDAHRALDAGLDGIVVSNHGGRQVDGAIASLDALAAITADKRVRESNLTIVFDSGIRTGSDVLKAMALGAHAVQIGRPYMYGLAIGGQQGVEHVLRCMLGEMDNTMVSIPAFSLSGSYAEPYCRVSSESRTSVSSAGTTWRSSHLRTVEYIVILHVLLALSLCKSTTASGFADSSRHFHVDTRLAYRPSSCNQSLEVNVKILEH